MAELGLNMKDICMRVLFSCRRIKDVLVGASKKHVSPSPKYFPFSASHSFEELPFEVEMYLLDEGMDRYREVGEEKL